jgi:hypothetical protein
MHQYEQSNDLFDGLVMVMDGFAVPMRKNYRFRKGGFAIIALVGCDAEARLISAIANHSGSTNDIIAWNYSKLCKAVEYDRHLPAKNFLFVMRLLQIIISISVLGQVESWTDPKIH